MFTKPSTTNDSQPTPTSKSSGDYVPASSTSLYAHPITSSSFTLWSTTDNLSASSALSDRKPNADDLPIMPSQKWNKLIGDHKWWASCLFWPQLSGPNSTSDWLRQYMICLRSLWHLASPPPPTTSLPNIILSPVYGCMDSTNSLNPFLMLPSLLHFLHKPSNIFTNKALGDLAHYCMAIATLVTGAQSSSPEELTMAAISMVISGRLPNPSLTLSSAPNWASHMSTNPVPCPKSPQWELNH